MPDDELTSQLNQAGLKSPKQLLAQNEGTPATIKNAGVSPTPTTPAATDEDDWASGPSAPPTAPRRVGDPANPIEDAWHFVKGFAGGISDVAQGYWNLATNAGGARDEWKRNVNTLMTNKGMWSGVGGVLWNGLKEETASHWTDPEGNFDLGYSLWHHPTSMLMDLAILKDIASGGASMYGKMAGGASRAEMTAAQLGKLGPMSTADRMIQLSEKLDKIHLDPLTLAAKGVGATKPVQWLKEELGFGPKGEHRAYDGPLANMQAQVNLERSQKQKLLIESQLGEGSGDMVFNALDRGSQADYAALQPEELDFIQRYRATQGQPTGGYYAESKELPNREQMLKERGYIPQDTTRPMAIQAALREWGEGGVTEERIAEAADKIKAGEWNPTYRFLAHEKSHEYSMLESMAADARGERLASETGQGVGAQIKTRTGQGVYEKDPLVSTFRQMDMEAQMDKRIRMKDTILNIAQRRGELKVIHSADDLPQGWKIMPVETWERALVQEKRAQGLAMSAQLQGLDKTAATRDMYSKIVSDPATWKAIQENPILAVPNWLGNYTRFRMAIPGPLARTYDNLFRYWKSWATILHPSYWLNVMAGNGALAALHGVSPMDAARYWRNRKALPAELRAIAQIPNPHASLYQKSVTTGRNVDSMLHTNLDKGPAFAKDAEAFRQALVPQAAALHKVGADFDVSAKTLADPDKWNQMIGQAPGELANMIREHTVLREQMAQHSGQLVQKQAEYKETFNALQEAKRAAMARAPKGSRTYGALTPEELELANKEQSQWAELEGLKEQHMKLLDRNGMIQSAFPEKLRFADWAEKVIEPANELQGSYNRLHPLERTWISRALPFYPWVKAMSALAFRLPFLYPKQTFMWNRYSSMMNDLMSHDEHIPPWLQGAIHVGVTGDGSHVFVNPIWNPFKSAEPVRIGGVSVPGIVGDFARHPLLKVAMDLQGGVNSFTMKPWSTDETMTRTDRGEVYQLDPKTGQFVPTIAQPSIWKKLYNLFPGSQQIDQLFMPHVQTDRGWLLHPDPIVDRGGTPMFPIPFWQRAAKALGAPVSFQTDEQRQGMERKQNQLMKAYIKDIKHMPPDEQNSALRVLDDYMQMQQGNPTERIIRGSQKR